MGSSNRTLEASWPSTFRNRNRVVTALAVVAVEEEEENALRETVSLCERGDKTVLTAPIRVVQDDA